MKQICKNKNKLAFAGLVVFLSILTFNTDISLSHNSDRLVSKSEFLKLASADSEATTSCGTPCAGGCDATISCQSDEWCVSTYYVMAACFTAQGQMLSVSFCAPCA